MLWCTKVRRVAVVVVVLTLSLSFCLCLCHSVSVSVILSLSLSFCLWHSVSVILSLSMSMSVCVWFLCLPVRDYDPLSPPLPSSRQFWHRAEMFHQSFLKPHDEMDMLMAARAIYLEYVDDTSTRQINIRSDVRAQIERVRGCVNTSRLLLVLGL